MIALLVLFTSAILHAQQIPTKDGKAFYEVIDSAAMGSKQEIYHKARTWMAEAFKDAKEVIQLDDKENGELIGKGNFAWSTTFTPYRCRFTIKISARENKYRVQVYDMIVVGGTKMIEYPVEWYIEHPKSPGSRGILKSVHEGTEKMLTELKESMKKAADNF